MTIVADALADAVEDAEELRRTRRHPHQVQHPVAPRTPCARSCYPSKSTKSSHPSAAGFRATWGTVDVDGDELEICSGAGMGSTWATISFRGKEYAIGAHEIVEAFLDAVKGS